MSSSARLLASLILTTPLGLLPALSQASASPIQTHKLTDARPTTGDDFGASVALRGTTALIGSFRDDDLGVDTGSAFLFNAATGTQLHQLNADDADLLDELGLSVALGTSHALVGARLNDDAGSQSGSAYVFDPTTGDQLHKLTASDADAGDFFGRSVAAYGSLGIVGAHLDDHAGLASGSAYVFNLNTGGQLDKLTADDADINQSFGSAVALDGFIAGVGAPHNTDIGAVYLYNVLLNTQTHKLTADDGATGNRFGFSVTITDNTALIGAIGQDGTGAAYLFDTVTGTQLHKLTADDAAANDFFGWSVALSDGIAAVGAPLSDPDASASGAVYLFDVTTGEQITRVTPDDPVAGGQFGESVALDGTTLVVGAIRATAEGDLADTPGAGAAYVFEIPEPTSAALLLTLLAPGFRTRRP
ncbi:MAG: hypothetical protein AAGF84_03490 [Planctomycetota bacterium]